MNSRIALITVMTAAMSVGGLMAKDAPNQRQHGRFDKISSELNLTDQQKQEAHQLFKSGHEAARPEVQQLRQERKAVETAIQSKRPVAEIDRLAKAEGPTLGALAAKRAETSAKFYAMLTPEQQQKLASLHQEWQEKHAAAQHDGDHVNAQQSR